jgi:hypothetical protein
VKCGFGLLRVFAGPLATAASAAAALAARTIAAFATLAPAGAAVVGDAGDFLAGLLVHGLHREARINSLSSSRSTMRRLPLLLKFNVTAELLLLILLTFFILYRGLI